MSSATRGMFSVQGFARQNNVDGGVMLSDIVFDRVDLVDFGANFDVSSGDGSHVLLAKRADAYKSKEVYFDVEDLGNKNKDRGSFIMPKKLEKEKDQVSSDSPGADASETVKAAENTYSEEYVQELRDSLSKSEARITDLEKSIAEKEVIVESSDDSDDIWKSAPAGLRDAFEKQGARLLEAEEIAKRERDLRIEREYVEKAQSYSNVPYKVEDLSELLRKSHVLDKDLGKMVEDFVKSVDISFAEHSILSSAGSSAPDMKCSSVYEKVTKMAESLRSSDSSLSLPTAVGKVLSSNPSLYDEYCREVN